VPWGLAPSCPRRCRTFSMAARLPPGVASSPGAGGHHTPGRNGPAVIPTVLRPAQCPDPAPAWPGGIRHGDLPHVRRETACRMPS
jgi:hypothetical protein